MEYIYFIIQEMNKYNKKRKRKGKEGSIEQMKWLEEVTFFADVWQLWSDWLILK